MKAGLYTARQRKQVRAAARGAASAPCTEAARRTSRTTTTTCPKYCIGGRQRRRGATVAVTEHAKPTREPPWRQRRTAAHRRAAARTGRRARAAIISIAITSALAPRLVEYMRVGAHAHQKMRDAAGGRASNASPVRGQGRAPWTGRLHARTALAQTRPHNPRLAPRRVRQKPTHRCQRSRRHAAGAAAQALALSSRHPAPAYAASGSACVR